MSDQAKKNALEGLLREGSTWTPYMRSIGLHGK
jgi:hypothetical protein